MLIRHLGFWSLNGARVLDCADRADSQSVACVDPQSGQVMYRIRAVSWAQSPLAWIGQPIVRLLQAKFRKDSATVMQRPAAV